MNYIISWKKRSKEPDPEKVKAWTICFTVPIAIIYNDYKSLSKSGKRKEE